MHGTSAGGDADELRLLSTADTFINLRAHGGSLDFLSTKVKTYKPTVRFLYLTNHTLVPGNQYYLRRLDPNKIFANHDTDLKPRHCETLLYMLDATLSQRRYELSRVTRLIVRSCFFARPFTSPMYLLGGLGAKGSTHRIGNVDTSINSRFAFCFRQCAMLKSLSLVG